MIYSNITTWAISKYTNRHCIRFTEMAFVIVAIFNSGRPQFISKRKLHQFVVRRECLDGVKLQAEWKIVPFQEVKQAMITESDIQVRSGNVNRVVELANNLKGSAPVRSCDPIQVWEVHPVVSQYLDLKDREIAAAIDAANAA